MRVPKEAKRSDRKHIVSVHSLQRLAAVEVHRELVAATGDGPAGNRGFSRAGGVVTDVLQPMPVFGEWGGLDAIGDERVFSLEIPEGTPRAAAPSGLAECFDKLT